MKYRHLLLIATALALFHAFVLIRLSWFINIFPTYAGDDIRSMTHFSIATLAAWVVLEIAANRQNSRGLVCKCGYALHGIKCPECGEAIGADHRPAAPNPK